MNSCEISPKILGCKVVIETLKNGIVEGIVHKVNPSCDQVLLRDGCLVVKSQKGMYVSTGMNLPATYKIYAKDIKSIFMQEGSFDPKSGKLSPGILQVPTQALSLSDKKSQPMMADTEKRIVTPPRNGKSKSLVLSKSVPEHIRRLQNGIEMDVLTNKVPLLKDGDNELLSSLPDFTIIDQLDNLYYKAIDSLERENYLGLSMEGVRVGRFGVVCWIGVATSCHVFLFDMCSLGPAGVQQGLKKILMDETTMKITHDCRFMSDAFVHQYDVKLENVFDTQVGASVVELKNQGTFNRHVSSLSRCLSEFLNIPSNKMFHPRVRVGHEQEDESIWKQRPLPTHLQEGAVFNVCHLRKLRVAISETIMSEVIRGTSLYLKDISQLSDDSVSERMIGAHLIPTSFKDLVPHKNLPNGENFHNNVPMNGVDPYVSFTRHIAHVRKS